MSHDRLFSSHVHAQPGARSGSAEVPTPGRRTLVEALHYVEVPPVQRSAEATAAPEDAEHVRRAAQHGMSGSGVNLPHMESIQRAFGRHDVSGVRAHVGGAASEGASAMGARAYASGNQVAFAHDPDLHLAAHEAAHVVQQRGGVQLSGGVGSAGDAYEHHADAVADLVVRGESAEALLDTMAGGSGGGGAVQRDHRAHAARRAAAATIAPVLRAITAETSLDRLERARALLGAATTDTTFHVVAPDVMIELGGASVRVMGTDVAAALHAVEARSSTLVATEHTLAGDVSAHTPHPGGSTDPDVPLSVPDPQGGHDTMTTPTASPIGGAHSDLPEVRLGGLDITNVFRVTIPWGPNREWGETQIRGSREYGAHHDVGMPPPAPPAPHADAAPDSAIHIPMHADHTPSPHVTTTVRREHGVGGEQTTVRTSVDDWLRDRFAPGLSWVDDHAELDAGTGGIGLRAGLRFGAIPIPLGEMGLEGELRFTVNLAEITIPTDPTAEAAFNGPTLRATVRIPLTTLEADGVDIPGADLDGALVLEFRFMPNWMRIIAYLRAGEAVIEGGTGAAVQGAGEGVVEGAVTDGVTIETAGGGAVAEGAAGAAVGTAVVGAVILAAAVYGTMIWLDDIQDSLAHEAAEFHDAHQYCVHAGTRLASELRSFCTAYRAILSGTPLDEGSEGARHGAAAARARLDVLLQSYSLDQIREAVGRADVYAQVYAQVLPEFQARAVYLAQLLPLGPWIDANSSLLIQLGRHDMFELLAAAH